MTKISRYDDGIAKTTHSFLQLLETVFCPQFFCKYVLAILNL
jgi:hypothetical protein